MRVRDILLAGRTEGERRQALAYIVVAFFGAGLGLTVLTGLGGADFLERPLTWYELWVVIASAIGGAAGVRFNTRWIGVPGFSGFLRSIPGVLFVTIIGAVVAGTLALPLYGTMFGPFILLITMVKNPMLASLWVWCVMASHFLLTERHHERNSIFNRLRQQDDMPVFVRDNSGRGLNP